MKKFNEFLEEAYSAREYLYEAPAQATPPPSLMSRASGFLGKAAKVGWNVFNIKSAIDKMRSGDYAGGALDLAATKNPVAQGIQIAREIGKEFLPQTPLATQQKEQEMIRKANQAKLAKQRASGDTSGVLKFSTSGTTTPSSSQAQQATRPQTATPPKPTTTTQSTPTQSQTTQQTATQSSTQQPTPAATVLAKLKGQTGQLSKDSGTFTPSAWSSSQAQRYAAYGGK